MVAVVRLLSIGVAAVATGSGRIEAGRRKHELVAVGGHTDGGDDGCVTNTTSAKQRL